MREIQNTATDRFAADDASDASAHLMSIATQQPRLNREHHQDSASIADRIESHPQFEPSLLVMDEMHITGRDQNQPRATDGTPMYSQADARWSKSSVGNSTSNTMKASGCLVTSLAMSLSQKLERDVTPHELNGTLKQHGCFMGASLRVGSVPQAIEKAYGVDMPLTSSPRDKNWQLIAQPGAAIAAQMDRELAQGRHAILRLDTNDDGIMNHFALAVRKEGNEYVVIDPADGQEHRYWLDDEGRFIAREKYSGRANSNKRYAPQAQGYILES